jgi:flagellar basal-body rod protein FlgC
MTEIRNIFDISGRAMSAQITRLNAIASNLANARSVAGSEEEAYRALSPIFSVNYADKANKNGIATTDVEKVVQLNRTPDKVYHPDHPKADVDGFVYSAAVDTDEEMVEMLEASRQYQNNLEVVMTMRTLMMRTANMGR